MSGRFDCLPSKQCSRGLLLDIITDITYTVSYHALMRWWIHVCTSWSAERGERVGPHM